MIKEPGLSTIDSPSRYGGLLICGLEGEQIQQKSLNSTRLGANISRMNPARKGDRFISRLQALV